MKLTILKHELNEAIQHVSKAINSKTTIPILSGIKFDVRHDTVTLTASDIDSSIQATIPVMDEIKIEQTGSVVLPAKFLIEIIKKLPKETVEIEVGDNFSTRIRSGKTNIEMVGMDPEEFPMLPSVDTSRVINVQGDLLKRMIKATGFSVSTNESSPILIGILWNVMDGQLKLLATDRHRLASTRSKLDDAEGVIVRNVPISGKILNELIKIIPDNDEPVEITVADNQALFKVGHILFYSRILDGTFPDTSKIIPTDFKTELTVNTKDFTDALDRAYLLAREEKTNVVKLEAAEDGVKIESASDVGKVMESLAAESLNGESVRIAFNSKYMLDVLKVIDSKQLRICFTGPMSPIIIKPVDDSQSLYLILPYRMAN